MELPEDAMITVISKRPVAGLKAQRLERIQLLGGKIAMLLADDDPAPVVVEEKAAVGRQAFEPDARARAILRGIENAEADLAEAGGAFELGEVQQLMGKVSRQRVERRVQEGSLLAVPGPSNRRRYPTLQFNADGSLVDGLCEVQRALAFSSPWSVLNFLVNPDDRLNGERPIDVLRRGNVDLVVESARRVGIQGA